jgi:hypothetical protein
MVTPNDWGCTKIPWKPVPFLKTPAGDVSKGALRIRTNTKPVNSCSLRRARDLSARPVQAATSVVMAAVQAAAFSVDTSRIELNNRE